MSEHVAVGLTEPLYNPTPPFHPDARFPELPFAEVSEQPNAPYRLLRELLSRLGLDRAHFGTQGWNPFCKLLEPGQTVVIKPNFVTSHNASGDDLFAVVTHPSLLRAAVDYCYVALGGHGRIIIADVPQMDCDWDQLMAAQRLDAIQEFYRRRLDFAVEVYDLREFALRDSREMAYSTNRVPRSGDPAGSVTIDLGNRSEFYGLSNANFYGADFDRGETRSHHCDEKQEYRISRTILAADAVISVPKMKVHKKVGVTLTLKGLVGINTNKNFLVHYRLGSPRDGGDQFPDRAGWSDRALLKAQRTLFDLALARGDRVGDLVYKAATATYRRVIKPFRHVTPETATLDGGNWHGNDSAWRMTADLAKIIYFADAGGKLHDRPQRKLFSIVDGIVGGELNGPLGPRAKPAGCLVAGCDPVAVDLVTTRLMGFDVKKVRQFQFFRHAGWQFPLAQFPLSGADDMTVLTDQGEVDGREFLDSASHDRMLAFEPHPGWANYLEVGCSNGERGLATTSRAANETAKG